MPRYENKYELDLTAFTSADYDGFVMNAGSKLVLPVLKDGCKTNDYNLYLKNNGEDIDCFIYNGEGEKIRIVNDKDTYFGVIDSNVLSFISYSEFKAEWTRMFNEQFDINHLLEQGELDDFYDILDEQPKLLGFIKEPILKDDTSANRDAKIFFGETYGRYMIHDEDLPFNDIFSNVMDELTRFVDMYDYVTGGNCDLDEYRGDEDTLGELDSIHDDLTRDIDRFDEIRHDAEWATRNMIVHFSLGSASLEKMNGADFVNLVFDKALDINEAVGSIINNENADLNDYTDMRNDAKNIVDTYSRHVREISRRLNIAQEHKENGESINR